MIQDEQQIARYCDMMDFMEKNLRNHNNQSNGLSFFTRQ